MLFMYENIYVIHNIHYTCEHMYLLYIVLDDMKYVHFLKALSSTE